MLGVIGFCMGIGLNAVHSQIVALRRDLRQKPTHVDSNKMTLYEAVDDLLRVHTATCNDGELSCEYIN
jgi:hypothetical protein